jgi:ketosteroid isomerase-like protein
VDSHPGETLDRLLTAIATRDLQTTLACWSPSDDVALLGSEVGESARGRRAIEGFFTRVLTRTESHRFELPDRTASVHGDVAWLVADGTVIDPGETVATPYRLTAVFVRSEDVWRIALWSGSVPIDARDS